MYSTHILYGAIALTAALPAAGQSLTTSLRSNFSLTSLRPSASPTPTGSLCCEILADGVGLNYWWNQTVTAYTATVITRYIEYNNVVSTELATITNVNATKEGSIPTDIIGTWNEYRMTTSGTQKYASYPTTTVASPTPHLVYNALMLFTGTWATNTQGATTCAASGGLIDRVGLSTPYVFVENPPVTRTDQAFLEPPPTDILNSAVLQNPTLLDKLPYFTDCTIISGTGQPTVHIPVTALTSHSSTTLRRTGDAPAPTTSDKIPTPTLTSEDVPAPTTTSNETPAPTTTNDDVPTLTTTTTALPIPPNTEPAPPATNSPENDSTTAPSQSTVPAVPQLPEGSNPSNGGNTPPSQPTVPVVPETPQGPTPTNGGNTTPHEPVVSTVPGSPDQPEVTNPLAPPPASNLPPPAGPALPSNEPELPFPIVPVPVPTATGDVTNPTTTANPGAVILPGDKTLNPGEQTTISGVVISVPSIQPTTPGVSPPVVVVNDRTSTVLAATPVVVIDGTTHTVPSPAPAATQRAAVSVTFGSQVVTFQAATASGVGVVLHNSETLFIGRTTTVEDQTIVASVVTSGTVVATVVEIVDESTTQKATLPSAAAPTGSKTSTKLNGASTASTGGPVEYTGAAESLYHGPQAWSLFNAVGAVLLAFA